MFFRKAKTEPDLGYLHFKKPSDKEMEKAMGPHWAHADSRIILIRFFLWMEAQLKASFGFKLPNVSSMMWGEALDLAAEGKTLTPGTIVGFNCSLVEELFRQHCAEWVPYTPPRNSAYYAFSLETGSPLGVPAHLKLDPGIVATMGDCPVTLEKTHSLSLPMYKTPGFDVSTGEVCKCMLRWKDVPEHLRVKYCNTTGYATFVIDSEAMESVGQCSPNGYIALFAGMLPLGLNHSSESLYMLEDGMTIPLKVAAALGFHSVKLIDPVPASLLSKPQGLLQKTLSPVASAEAKRRDEDVINVSGDTGGHITDEELAKVIGAFQKKREEDVCKNANAARVGKGF